jgi:hypothetical protein
MNFEENHALALLEKRIRISHAAKRMIYVTFQREGSFHFNVSIQVFHNDREIEFKQFKQWLENSFKSGVMQLDYKSCEMISDELYHYIANRYPDRDIEITVSEDGENGATIYYNTTKPYQSLTI